MVNEKQHREKLKEIKAKENEQLSKLHLIISVKELEKQLAKLEKNQQKLALLKDQSNIRKNL